MPINHDDPRVIKTRRGLRNAFVNLLKQKGYDAISIQDIADEAEMARVTFYRHYSDKEALLTDCLETLSQEFREKYARILADPAQKHLTPAHVFYMHLEEQEEMYKILFSSRGTQVVVDHLQEQLAASITAILSIRIAETNPAIPMDIIAHHAASATIGMGVWWLRNGKPYPVDTMATMTRSLSLRGSLGALGLEGKLDTSKDEPILLRKKEQ